MGSDARGGGFDYAIEMVRPRVVRLFGLKAGLSAGYGAGVLVSGDGLVVTVSSLLLDAERLRAVTADGTTYGADVIGTNEDTQLALLRLKPLARYDRRGKRAEEIEIGAGSFEYFEPGDSSRLTPGEWVLAGGNPFKVAQGEEQISVTAGVFSARTVLDAKRKTQDFPYRGDVLVIDAVTSTPGSPGGALVDIDGQWVGLIGQMVISNRTHTNFNYAIPVEVVKRFIDSVLDPTEAEADSTVPHAAGYHGIKLFELGYQKKLVYVESVKRGSPARVAGVQKDDLIVSVGGVQVNDIETFKEIMKALKPGDKVDLAVIRDRKLFNLSFELGKEP